jgi:2-polyprenyl-3-methyl-5-hydroxy-6-metoxy-1,4-benzoquinol methylase
MSRDAPGLRVSPTFARESNAPDWDRLWRHQPSDARDEQLLQRERRSLRWASVVSHLEATFGSIDNLRTIELGSGRGDLSALLAERGADVTLVDSSERALAQARQRFDRLGLPARFESADLFRAREAFRGRFHVALSSGVIEHFCGEERTRAIRAHCEVLRSGGLAVISVPNAWCLSYRARKLYLELRGWWPYGQELPYTRREIIRRAKEAGFARIEAGAMRFPRSIAPRRTGGGNHRESPEECQRPQAAQRTSRLDSLFGFVLLLFGWRLS